ncbi:unnamed protein product [Arabidopsis halleri]
MMLRGFLNVMFVEALRRMKLAETNEEGLSLISLFRDEEEGDPYSPLPNSSIIVSNVTSMPKY